MAKTETKKNIKNASINLFYKKGYYATGISDIARDAGIQKSTIYYHYPNKQEILLDIFKTTMDDLDVFVDNSMLGMIDAEACLKRVIESHICFHIDRQKEAFIADSELRSLTSENYKVIVAMRDNYDSKLQRVIKRGMDEGIFFVRDYKILSYVIITMCTSVTNYFNPRGRFSKEEIAKLYSDFISSAMKVMHF